MILAGQLAGRELLLNWHPDSRHLVLLLDGRVMARSGGRSGNPRVILGPAAREDVDLDHLSVTLDELSAVTLDVRIALASSRGGSEPAPTANDSADIAQVGAVCATCGGPMIVSGPLIEPSTCPNCTVKRMDCDRLAIAFQLVTMADGPSRSLADSPRRGHRFVRYADDGNVYVKTERAGRGGRSARLAIVPVAVQHRAGRARLGAWPEEQDAANKLITAWAKLEKVVGAANTRPRAAGSNSPRMGSNARSC